MEIPCHFTSSQIDGSLVKMDTKSHDYSHVIHPGFMFSMLEHDMDFGLWTSSSHGISEAFAKKMTGFPSDLVSFSN